MSSPRQEDRFVVWAAAGMPESPDGAVYLWSGHADHGAARSILLYAERNGERIRRKALALIHEIGEFVVDGTRLIDHLSLGDGFSYWWLSPFVERNPYRFPISDIVRLLALQELIGDANPREVHFVGPPSPAQDSILELCARREIEFHHELRPGTRLSKRKERGAKSGASSVARGLARRLRAAHPYFRAGRGKWLSEGRSLLFCDYFVNVVPAEAEEGRFRSRYWEGVPSLASELGFSLNWLHHNPAPPSSVALEWVSRINRHPHREGVHNFLDSYLSIGVVFRALRGFVRLARVRRALGEVGRAFQQTDGDLSLWPLLADEWERSLSGATAIGNLITLELFEAALADLPHQELGLYLMENNEWERAFIHAWRKNGHGRLVGVAHSTVRFWDLRYFTDPRTLLSDSAHPIPEPDAIAVNGAAALGELGAAEMPAERLVECEAVRYQRTNAREARSCVPSEGEGRRVLVIGDIDVEYTESMLRMLERIAPRLTQDLEFALKAHPASPFDPSRYPGLELRSIDGDLGGIVGDYHLAFASSTTSGAVDAWLAGVPVVVLLDPDEVNFSPLRGEPGARFVSTDDQLIAALTDEHLPTANTESRLNFFYRDPELPRWTRLLSDRRPAEIRNRPPARTS